MARRLARRIQPEKLAARGDAGLALSLVVDARVLWGSGIGRYVREITARLIRRGAFGEVVLAGNPIELKAWCDAEAFGRGVRILPVSGGRYSVASQLSWMRTAKSLPHNAVVWFPHWDAPFYFRGPPSVVTVHDLIQLRVPGYAGPAKRWAMRRLLSSVTKRARRVVTVSEFTRRDLLAVEPGLKGRVDIVAGGVAAAFFEVPADTATLPDRVAAPFILCIANRKRHKNLRGAVEVLAKLKKECPAMTLVVGGEWFPEWRDVMARAELLGVADAIIDLPRVSDAQLVALYGQAECLLFPSRYEGFGLPVLEAMACGAPVVASNATAIPEVAGDAALRVSPDDIDGMTAAVRRIRDDRSLRASLIARGRERAAGFTWDRSVAAMEQILLEAAQ